jgi:DNA polymerase III delta prime subunit
MSSELMLGGFGQQDNRKSVMVRASKAERAMQQREQQEATNLMFEARKQEATALLRKRMSETAMYDVQDVGELARELANGDAFLASLLVPIVEEFARQTVRDIRTFGHGF